MVLNPSRIEIRAFRICSATYFVCEGSFDDFFCFYEPSKLEKLYIHTFPRHNDNNPATNEDTGMQT